MSVSAWSRLAKVTATFALLGSCSSHDVSLGDDRPSPPVDPTPPEPEPEPEPEPVPVPPRPCELQNVEAFCLSATDHCSGRILTGPGNECLSGEVCCRQTVGSSWGGSTGIEPPAAGAGGQ